MHRRIILVILFLALGFFIRLHAENKETIKPQSIPQARPQDGRYCFDFAKAMPQELVDEISAQGASLRRNFDIDFVVAIVPSLNNRDIGEYAADLFSRWGIGKSTQGKKGILILIAMQEEKIKIEIGYDLEHIYTDLYVATVEREMLKEFLEQADWERGFLATIENFVERTYRMYKKGLDVRQGVLEGDNEYYSGGAGAKTVFDFGAALKKAPPQTPQNLKEYFSAQFSPELAFQRYMEFNTLNMSDYTLDIFSDASKEFFSHWRTSSGQRRAEAEAASGKPYIIKIKGNYAVLMAPTETSINDFITQCPYFFIKTEKGWQVDINIMARSLMMGGPSWHFLSKLHPYMFAFDNYLIMMNRYYPLAGQKAFLGLTYSLWDNGIGGFKVSPEWESPAKEAGIEDGDILISIEGVEIKEPYQDWEMMKKHNPGDTVNVVVKRNGLEKTFKITLADVNSLIEKFPYRKKEGDPWLGLYIGYSEPYERQIAETYDCILDVIKASPAEKIGLKPGDCIIYDNNRDRLFSKDLKPGDKLKIRILRNLKDKLDFTLEIGSYSPGKEGI